MDLKDNSRKLAVGMFAVSSFLAGWSFSSAQVVTGQLGSPNATTTIEGKTNSCTTSEIRRRNQAERD